MRFGLFLAFVISCVLAVVHGMLGESATSAILGAIWTLIAVVAMGFRAVLDALRVRAAADEPAPPQGPIARWLAGK